MTKTITKAKIKLKKATYEILHLTPRSKKMMVIKFTMVYEYNVNCDIYTYTDEYECYNVDTKNIMVEINYKSHFIGLAKTKKLNEEQKKLAINQICGKLEQFSFDAVIINNKYIFPEYIFNFMYPTFGFNSIYKFDNLCIASKRYYNRYFPKETHETIHDEIINNFRNLERKNKLSHLNTLYKS